MKSRILTLIAACICGLIGGAAGQFSLSNTAAQAAGEPQTTFAERFVLRRGSLWPAVLYVDTALNRTRLDLRDPQGRLRMIISAWGGSEGPAAKKATIEFFDGNDNRIGIIDGTAAN
jgi:hypothetical protein